MLASWNFKYNHRKNYWWKIIPKAPVWHRKHLQWNTDTTWHWHLVVIWGLWLLNYLEQFNMVAEIHSYRNFWDSLKRCHKAIYLLKLKFSRRAAQPRTWYPWVLFWLPKSGTPGSAHVVWLGSEDSGAQANLLLLLVLLLEVFDKYSRDAPYISVTIWTGAMTFVTAVICNMDLGRDRHKLRQCWWFEFTRTCPDRYTRAHIHKVHKCTFICDTNTN